MIHSVELFYFVAYRHTPMVRNPEKFGITIHKQEEYDLPLDYYYTLNEPVGSPVSMRCSSAKSSIKNDFQPWAVRVNAREHVFLYISKFGTNKLPQIYAQAADGRIAGQRVRLGDLAGGSCRGRRRARRYVSRRLPWNRLNDDWTVARIVA